MTNRASDRGSGDRMMPCKVADYGSCGSARKTSGFGAANQPEANQKRND
jgi:hypothetical protein